MYKIFTISVIKAIVYNLVKRGNYTNIKKRRDEQNGGEKARKKCIESRQMTYSQKFDNPRIHTTAHDLLTKRTYHAASLMN